jgi:hypothetical protein
LDILNVLNLFHPELLVLLLLDTFLYNSLNFSFLSEEQHTSLTSLSSLIHRMLYLLPLVSDNPRVEIGKWLRWVLPCPLSPALGHGTAPSLDFFTILNLLPLSTILQGGNRELSCLGFALLHVLTDAKVRTRGIT